MTDLFTSVRKNIIALIKAAVTGQAQGLTADFSLTELLPVIKSHQITVLAYEGAVRCGISPDAPGMKELFKLLSQTIYMQELLKKELGGVLADFSAAGIDMAPLKGASVKKLYPRENLRQMSDADILTREKDRAIVHKIMKARGFGPVSESEYVMEWPGHGVMIEVHKRLIPEGEEDLAGYFGDGWDFMQPTEDIHVFAMKPEDEFIYLLAHFTKHYRNRGIGSRHMTDLWVYRRAHQDMDETYIMDRLAELHLDRFYVNVIKALQCWFEDGSCDDAVKLITDTVFESGAFGRMSVSPLSQSLKERSRYGKEGAKSGYIRERIFPSVRSLSGQYHVLKKAPVLYPFCWLHRAFKVIFTKPQRISQMNAQASAIDSAAVDEYKAKLNAVGLDYFFENTQKVSGSFTVAYHGFQYHDSDRSGR